MSSPDGEGPGFYGKVPSHADFLSRRLPAAFVGPWDEWLQGALMHSQRQLAEQWLEVYLGSPIWRFSLSAGIGGNRTWLGVLMPSVDRVGRYFPLTLAIDLPPETPPLVALARASDWLEAMESVALSGLEDRFDIQRFEQEVRALGIPNLREEAELPSRSRESQGYNAWQLSLPPDGSPLDQGPALLHRVLDEFLFAYSLWWTHGSERVEPSLLLCQGLPPSAGFSGLLGGGWGNWGRLGYSSG